MKRDLACFLSPLAAGLLLMSGGPSIVRAADCQAIRETVRNERSLIKKKTLLKLAVEVDCPQDIVLNLSYAFTLERLRKYEQALEYYQKASIISRRTSAKAYFGMGDVLLALNRLDDAIAAYEYGLKIDATNERVRQNLEQSKIKRKAQAGEQITTTEFTEVMQADPADGKNEATLAGPVLNLQIQFQSGSVTLSNEARSQIDTIGQALSNPALSDARFEIIGHTDNVGEPAVNLYISEARAAAVRDYLIQTHHIEPTRLSVAFFGDTRPLVPNTSPENQATNRRVEFKRID